MSRPGITYQEVANAAQSLHAQGLNPTIEKIRKLTGTGSHGTIAPFLRRWKENQNEIVRTSTKEKLPDELVACLKGLWEKVMSQSDAEVIRIQETAQNAIAELEQELQKYKSNNQRWQQLYNQWVQEKSQLANDKLTLEQALKSKEEICASLSVKQEILLQQANEKQERILELQRLHSQTQSNLEHYRESVREQRMAEEERYEKTRHDLEQSINQLQQQLKLSEQEKSELNLQYIKMTHDYALIQDNHIKLMEDIKQINNHYSKTEKELLETIQTNKYLENQQNILQQKTNEHHHALIELQKQNAISLKQLETAQMELKISNDQNKLLALEKWELAQEKSTLQGQLKQLETMLKKREREVV